MNKISDQFSCSYLYNIVSINNLQSILTHGILSKNLLLRHPEIYFDDISNLSVQSRRDSIPVTDGYFLHDYANLYFNPRNAMLYSLRDKINNLCILRIDKKVLDLEDTVVTDKNAAKGLVSFMTPFEAIKELNFNMIYQESWNFPNPIIKEMLKSGMMAEVLVLHKINPWDIKEILVPNEYVKQKIEKMGITLPIKIDEYKFFIT